MFRSTIKDGKDKLKGISKDVGKLNKFQSKNKGKFGKLLKQKVGEVKKTLPSPESQLNDCLKKVGDIDLCNVVLDKYSEFYNRMCLASPALCDDQPRLFKQGSKLVQVSNAKPSGNDGILI